MARYSSAENDLPEVFTLSFEVSQPFLRHKIIRFNTITTEKSSRPGRGRKPHNGLGTLFCRGKDRKM